MRLNTDDHALTDPRFMRLGLSLGITRHAARGHCEPVWMRCFSLRTNRMEAQDVDAMAEIAGFAKAMVGASLARVIDDPERHLWICGVQDRLGWLLEQDRKRELALAARRSRGVSHGKPPEKSPGDVPGDVPSYEQEQEQDLLIPGKPDPASELAVAAVAAINALEGRAYQADSEETLRLCRALVRAQITTEQVLAAIEHVGRPWIGTQYPIRPSTLLQLRRVRAALDDLAAGARRTPAQGRLSIAAPATDRFVFDDGTSAERRAAS